VDDSQFSCRRKRYRRCRLIEKVCNDWQQLSVKLNAELNTETPLKPSSYWSQLTDSGLGLQNQSPGVVSRQQMNHEVQADFALSLCFLGDRKPGGSRVAGKQKPAVPPARRRLSQLAVPAGKRALKRRMETKRNQGQTAGENPTAGIH